VPSVNFNYSFQSRSPLMNGFVDQLLIETGPAGTQSGGLCTPDSIIDGVYRLCLDCSAARQKARWSWVRSAAETRPLTLPGDVTLFTLTLFAVELGCFHLFLSHYKLLKIFARNLHMLLRIDYTSTCVIHFKCTLLLEDIISRHVEGRFLWSNLY